MGEPLVITVFLLTAVTMRFPFTCKQPLWAVQLVLLPVIARSPTTRSRPQLSPVIAGSTGDDEPGSRYRVRRPQILLRASVAM